VYVPATAATLRTLVEAGELPDGTAFAVTAGLREWYVDDDLEALEYAAMLEAARASLRLLDAEPAAPRRRVVIAADAPDGAVTVRDDLDRGVVRVDEPIAIAAVCSVHVDDADAADTVAAAAESITAADLGDTEAQDRVDDAEGFELSWYASQEIAALLDSL
jgi:glycine/D-amino acid oxidase-like deaminating enzyme